MKELKILKGRPLLNYVILTADKYTKEDTKGDVLYNTELEGKLKPYQKIISISPRIASTGLEPGMLVLINVERYGKAIQKRDAFTQSEDELHNATKVYHVPMIDIDGKECLKLGDNDIEFIIDEHTFEEREDDTPLIVMPKDPKIILPN